MLTPEQEKAYQGVYINEYPVLTHLNLLRSELERLNQDVDEWKQAWREEQANGAKREERVIELENEIALHHKLLKAKDEQIIYLQTRVSELAKLMKKKENLLLKMAKKCSLTNAIKAVEEKEKEND